MSTEVQVYEAMQAAPERMSPKDPDATLDYVFDWSTLGWLQTGEAIISRTVTVSSGITKNSDTESGGRVTVWLSGGSVNREYLVECRIQTDGGRTDERSMLIPVGHR